MGGREGGFAIKGLEQDFPVPNFDIIVVGGGIGGSSFATVMARRGVKVLVLEKELRFRDRVRGEFLNPWGVAEARDLGLLETFREAGAWEARWFEMGGGPLDLIAATPQRLPAVSYSHPRLQEELLAEAQKAGSEVRRGATVRRVEPGSNPVVECEGRGSAERLTARLVVAADGRNSAARRWAGLKSQRDEAAFLVSGVLLNGASFREDTGYVVFNPVLGTSAAVFPQGKGRFRAYFGYLTTSNYRMQGREKLPLFLAESVKAAPMLVEFYAKAEACGPLASFDASDSWVEHPYRDGVALIGDAAATSDPTYGQGMSLTLRDVRSLRDCLSSSTDWDREARRYAQQHDTYFARCHTVCSWFRHIFLEQTPEAELQRRKAMPLIAQDPTRVPGHLGGGPELPVDDAVKARFFGES